MGYDVSLLLDGLILVFLGVTIYYAARLSIFLKTFRENKNGMKLLIRDLTVTIQKSEQAIETMKKQAVEAEKDIREIVKEARFLSDELRFMNETGDGLADRLEKLADRNRELVDLMEKSGGIGPQRIIPERAAATRPAPKPQKQKEESAIFEIEDFDIDEYDMEEDDERDFAALEDGAYREAEAAYQSSHQSKVNTDSKSKVRSFAIFDRDFAEDEEEPSKANDAPAMEQSLKSRAEQDLYEALQRKKRIRETS